MPDLNPVEEIETLLEEDTSLSDEQVETFMEFVSDHYFELSYGLDTVKLQALYAEKFQNISEKSMSLKGHNQIIYGMNSQGKTSFINAIQFNLLGLPENRQAHRMTNLIREAEDYLGTRGLWLTDSSPFLLERYMERKGRGGALHGDDEPTITEISEGDLEPPEDHDIPKDRYNQPHEVFEKIGILPIVNRGYSVYEFMSLYFMMPHNFLNFLNWSNSPEIIDIVFGIYLTNVLNAIEEKDEYDVSISDEMIVSKMNIENYQNDLDKARNRLDILKQEEEQLQSKIADKKVRLESLKQESDAEERLNDLRSQKSQLQARRADIKTEQSEKVSELAEAERKIQRYEDSELIDDIGDVGHELQSLLTVPDRCPVCTNAVDGEQRERMLKHQHCPLCDKEVDDELIQVEREYQPDDSLFDRREEQEKELEDLEAERRELELQIQRLEERIQDTEEEIAEIEETIQEQDLHDTLDQRVELEQEIRELRREAVDVEVDIENTEDKISQLEYEVKANEHLATLLDERKQQKEAWETLYDIVSRVRKDNRRDLQSELRAEMEEELLPKFEQGLFAEASGVSFDSPDDYHFTVHSQYQNYKSSRTEHEAAEATLHALLFHLAVLKLLTEESNAPPIRMLVIDSPMANDMDANNRHDVTNLLADLPEYLSEYQVIISMAYSDDTTLDRLEQSPYSMEEFRKAIDDTSSSTSEDDSGVEGGSGSSTGTA